jgi:hypothetical protein
MLALTLIGGPVVVAGANDAGGGEPAVRPVEETAATESLVGLVGALASPTDETDVLPELAQSELRAIGPEGVRIEDTVLATADGARRLYLTPAPGWVCLSLVEAGGATVNCVPEFAIESGEGTPTAIRTGCTQTSAEAAPECTGEILYGVVRDEVHRATVTVEHGIAPTTGIVNNAYIVDVSMSQRPSTIQFSGPDVSFAQRADF